jgi:hypothetical protein
LNCEAAITLPASAFTVATPASTTSMSAPRDQAIWAGTTTWKPRPCTASTSVVVAEAAKRPLLSWLQVSPSPTVSFTLKP